MQQATNEHEQTQTVIDASAEFDQARQHIHTGNWRCWCGFAEHSAGSGNGKIGDGVAVTPPVQLPHHISPAILEQQIIDLKAELAREQKAHRETRAALDEACTYLGRMNDRNRELGIGGRPTEPLKAA